MVAAKPELMQILVLDPNGKSIGNIGSLTKLSENDEYVIYECNRFCLNASIAEYYKDRKKFTISVLTFKFPSTTPEPCSVFQRDCFIQDHSFCFTPNVSDKVEVKAYKSPIFDKEDMETYEKWLESRFIW